MQTFTPPRPPQIGTAQAVQYKTLQAEFGDGYEQPVGDGLNNALERWTLVWAGLGVGEFNQIRAFLDARGGTEVFLWIPNGEAVARKVRCGGWQRGDASEVSDQLSVEFKEVIAL